MQNSRMRLTDEQKLDFIKYSLKYIRAGTELSDLLRSWSLKTWSPCSPCPDLSSIPELSDRGPYGDRFKLNPRVKSLKKAKKEILCRKQDHSFDLTNYRKTILWIDDKRNPYLNWNKKVPEEEGELYWVRGFREFKSFIEDYGVPHVISFDHDLSPEHYVPKELWNDYYLSKKYQEAMKYSEGTGEDCAIWLMNYLKENEIETPKFFVHSSNEVGRDKIKEALGLQRVKQLKNAR